MMNLNSRIAQLLEILMNRWSFWNEHEDTYFELASTLVADPAVSPERWERELFHEIRAELSPENRQNLPELIRAYRAAVRRQREEERQEKIRRNAERRRREEERQRRNEERRRREEEQREEERRNEERRQREEEQWKEERRILLGNLRELFEQNFLAADNFHQTKCTDYISTKEYETEKINYVQSWAEGLGFKYPPDPEQAAAIGAVEGNVQVVARAGSGKTSTLVNRALFLQQHCGVAPDEMLLLAFNRKAAEEMQKRLDETLQGSTPHVMTFHALAYALVRPDKEILFDEEEGEQRQSRAIQDIVDHYLRDSSYHDKIRVLMTMYLNADLDIKYFGDDWERIVSGGYDRNPEDMLRYRRSLAQESLDGTHVKSFGEKVIANFLFEHDIEYRYGRDFWENGVNYRPDFRIGNKNGVIIEYFGLRGEPDYDAMSEKKRDYWRNNPNWELLEFSPNDLKSKGVEGYCTLLQQKLEACGILCNRLSEEEIWNRIKDRAIDSFTKATVGFINRCRKLSLTARQLSERVDNHICEEAIERRFLNLVQVFYKSYLGHLQATGEDDFDGLVQKAEERVATGKTVFRRRSDSGDLKRIRYVFIDEYQDFSELFYRMMAALREQNPRARFFCVGDDWQAINGFAGSELRFFQNFEQFFENARELPVATNYRSAKAIVNIGNALMRGRGIPARAHTNETGKVTIANLDTFEPTPQEQYENREASLTAVLRLVNRAINDGKDVVLLSRKNSLPWPVNYQDQGNSSSENELDRFRELVRSRLPDELAAKVTISTVHKYKGLEKDVVIVLDAVSGCYPLIHPHWIFTRVLGDTIERIVAEERRLFYVALTRAVENLFILTKEDEDVRFAPFLEDIERGIERIEWSNYPPIESTTQYITIRVDNQNGRGSEPTFAIKDSLHDNGYTWDNLSKTWWRIRLAEGFTVLGFINQASWSDSADGIKVGFCDYLDNEIALYHVDKGQWSCIYDNIQELDD